MTFSSAVFLLAFLPVTYGIFLILVHAGAPAASLLIFVSLASLVFYAWAGVGFLLIFLCSIAINYFLAGALANARAARRSLLLAGGIAFNLGLLGYFKYKNFFLSTFGLPFAADAAIVRTVLPVGISFYTFQKVAYLVDIARGHVRPKPFLHYLFFVTFFPQLVAGPIVRHDDIFPNLPRFGENVRRAGYAVSFLVPAIALIVVGLAKKTLFADSFAMLAGPAFDLAAQRPLSMLPSWIGLLAYSLQIYFDFSGYSDMAIGLALLFGIRLPSNFDSPYKAVSIIDFWRRWHITLSRFLRDYLYIPLGGNRSGSLRRFANLMLTMLIGGLWHGASWNFVLWGGLHGCMLSLNHAARHFKLPKLPRALAVLLVFVFVTLAWVPFRAPDFPSTLSYYRGLFGFEGLVLPPVFNAWASPLGISISANLPSFSGLRGILAVTGGLAFVWLLPNSLVLLTADWQRWLARSAVAGVACAGAFVLCAALIYARESTPFIYFQF